jgi:uncharacterized protein YcbK (DUF882 family)
MGDLTKNFSYSEFECRCGCKFNSVQIDLVTRLQRVRDEWKWPIRINSGSRCETHNDWEGGTIESSHLIGMAADIKCNQSAKRYALLPIILKHFPRIGVGEDFIHVDVNPDKYQDVLWTYSN